MMRRVLGSALLLAAALAACDGSNDAERPRATVPTATTTTASADPYAVPKQIDVAYLQRVIDKLYEIDGDATRLIVEAGDFTPPATDRLRAVYSGDELNHQLSLWDDAIRDGLASFFRPPGDRRIQVEEVVSSAPTCIFLRAMDDFRAVARDAPPPSATYFALVTRDPGRDPGHINPTPWAVGFEAVPDVASGQRPENPCEA